MSIVRVLVSRTSGDAVRHYRKSHLIVASACVNGEPYRYSKANCWGVDYIVYEAIAHASSAQITAWLYFWIITETWSLEGSWVRFVVGTGKIFFLCSPSGKVYSRTHTWCTSLYRASVFSPSFPCDTDTTVSQSYPSLKKSLSPCYTPCFV